MRFIFGLPKVYRALAVSARHFSGGQKTPSRIPRVALSSTRINGADARPAAAASPPTSSTASSNQKSNSSIVGDVVTSLESTVHQLNHQSSRTLNGHNPCELFHNAACRWNATIRERQQILRLLLSHYWETIAKVPNPTQPQCAAHWRHTVESWLRRQGLIEVRLNQNKQVSTNSPKIWSHN